MRTIAQLIAAMEAMQTEMEGLLTSAEKATEDKAKEGFRAAFHAKSLDMQTLKSELEEAKTIADTRATLAAAKALKTVDVEGKNLNPTNQPGEAAKTHAGQPDVTLDAEKDARERKGFFMSYLRDGAKALDGQAMKAISPQDPRLANSADAVLLPKDMARRVLGKTMLTTDATGAATDSGTFFTLAPDYRPELLKPPLAMPTLFDLCRQTRGYNGHYYYPKLDTTQGNFGGVAFTWKTTEGADKAETEPTFGLFTGDTHELSGWTQMSHPALRRPAIDVEAELTTLFRDAAKYEISRCILNGTGSHQPTGLLATGSGITEVGRQAAGAVSGTDLVNLQWGVTMGARVGGRYVVADSAEKVLADARDAEERPLFIPNFATGMPTTLLNRPYTTHEYTTPVLGELGDVIFGNFANYIYAVEEDIAIARSEHAEFKRGLVVFRMICFVGGAPLFPTTFAALTEGAVA